MTVQEAVKATDAVLLTTGTDKNRAITVGYACDLLSWVMSHGENGMAWITVQTHMNVIAVASLADMACVIVPEGIAVDPAVVSKAQEEGIAILSTKKSAFEVSGILYSAGIACK